MALIVTPSFAHAYGVWSNRVPVHNGTNFAFDGSEISSGAASITLFQMKRKNVMRVSL